MKMNQAGMLSLLDPKKKEMISGLTIKGGLSVRFLMKFWLMFKLQIVLLLCLVLQLFMNRSAGMVKVLRSYIFFSPIPLSQIVPVFQPQSNTVQHQLHAFFFTDAALARDGSHDNSHWAGLGVYISFAGSNSQGLCAFVQEEESV